MKIKKEVITRCVDGKLDPVIFCRDFYRKTGIKIMAEKETDVVHGYIKTYHFKPEYKGICKAGREIKGEHTCVEIFFYDQNEEPNENIITSDGKRLKTFGHKSRIRKHRDFNRKKKDINSVFKKFKLVKKPILSEGKTKLIRKKIYRRVI